jgi:hypothetical protein
VNRANSNEIDDDQEGWTPLLFKIKAASTEF